MFRINKQENEEYIAYHICNESTSEYISIIPAYGGNINDLKLSQNGKLHSLIDGYKTKEEFEIQNYYKGPKLLPFPNRIKNGVYSFEGKEYQLPINEINLNNALHGFFYKRKFDVKDIFESDYNAILTLESIYRSEVEGYPFSFQTVLKYEFSRDQGIILHTYIKNICDEPIPIGEGWHPYFTLGCPVDNLFLKIPACKKYKLDEQQVPNGESEKMTRFIKSEKISEFSIDDGFIIKDNGPIVATEISCPDNDLKLTIWQETGFRKYNYLQLFIPPDRKSIAVEPMTCSANAFNSKDGLIILTPGEIHETKCGVKLS